MKWQLVFAGTAITILITLTASGTIACISTLNPKPSTLNRVSFSFLELSSVFGPLKLKAFLEASQGSAAAVMV